MNPEQFNWMRNKGRELAGPPMKHINIMYSPQAIKQFRFPRSKRKRIRVKWEKQKRNFRPFIYKIELADRISIIAHPSFRPRLENLTSYHRTSHGIADACSLLSTVLPY